MWDNNGKYFRSTNYDTWDFPETIDVPDNYFGYVQLRENQWGWTYGVGSEELYSSSINYICNAF